MCALEPFSEIWSQIMILEPSSFSAIIVSQNQNLWDDLPPGILMPCLDINFPDALALQ